MDFETVNKRVERLVSQACENILRNQSDPKEDARQERARATFKVEDLAIFMNDGEETLRRR